MKISFFIWPQDYHVIFDRQPSPSFEHDRDQSPYLIMVDFYGLTIPGKNILLLKKYSRQSSDQSSAAL